MSSYELRHRPAYGLMRRTTLPATSSYNVNLGDACLAGCASITRMQGEMMTFVYSTRGGLCSSYEVLDLLRRRFDQPISMLAKWIVRRSIVSMQWNTQTLLPLFQFDLREMTVRHDVSAVITELTCAFDDWEIAHWFTEPNTWLEGVRPVDLFASEPAEVLMAARADRFVALG